jgi:hypothetical protein
MTDSTLRAGSYGVAVTALQMRLTAAGHRVTADGWYGPDTERAVRAFQRARGLVADGRAGARTTAALTGPRQARDLTQADIERAAAALGCTAAAILAITEVECPGSGFLPDGRVVILFERHVFWQRLQLAGIDPATTGLPADVLSQQRGGYLGGAAEYTRLARAAAADQLQANESCSWGRFQIMGYHAQELGYADAIAMAAAFAIDEGEHLRAFVRFIKLSEALQQGLIEHDWPRFARHYNGPAYAANAYDARLAAAYARHAGAAEASA